MGVILYEFLYGIPPFHAETPMAVFENILARNIDWHEDEMDLTPEAFDLMNKLMCTSIELRLGTHSADEVKNHPFFKDINWSKVAEERASFIPKPANAEDTEYFDNRGADETDFNPEEEENNDNNASQTSENSLSTPNGNEFGSFVYKNLPLLVKANSDVVKKIKSDVLLHSTPPYSPSGAVQKEGISRNRCRSISLVSQNNRMRQRMSSLNDGLIPQSPSGGNNYIENIKQQSRFDHGRRNSLPLKLSQTMTLTNSPLIQSNLSNVKNSSYMPSILSVSSSNGSLIKNDENSKGHLSSSPTSGKIMDFERKNSSGMDNNITKETISENPKIEEDNESINNNNDNNKNDDNGNDTQVNDSTYTQEEDNEAKSSLNTNDKKNNNSNDIDNNDYNIDKDDTNNSRSSDNNSNDDNNSINNTTTTTTTTTDNNNNNSNKTKNRNNTIRNSNHEKNISDPDTILLKPMLDFSNSGPIIQRPLDILIVE